MLRKIPFPLFISGYCKAQMVLKLMYRKPRTVFWCCFMMKRLIEFLINEENFVITHGMNLKM